MIIQPFVENAIWHGLLPKESNGHLSISLSSQGDSLEIIIADNGIGRAKADSYKSTSSPTRKSMGMKLTEERLKLAAENLEKAGSQKIIDLFDEQGNPSGTKVVLTIPI
ncbi:MAG: hypothetical protein IPM92_16765 [Saprospiraceae bacterium]|nr:hypothetical protein [Saprospiraceae bacterium]